MQMQERKHVKSVQEYSILDIWIKFNIWFLNWMDI